MQRMSTLPKQRMTVDEFLVWAGGRVGKYELHGGRIAELSPEPVRHIRAKQASFAALDRALRRAGIAGEVLCGAAVRVADDAVYRPDVVVYCGEKLSGDTVEIPDPAIIVQVPSLISVGNDSIGKLPGYFSLPSVRHYLIVDPDKRVLVYYARGDDEFLATRILSSGSLKLDPPGLALSVEELFPEP